jgi:hypothetical protein
MKWISVVLLLKNLMSVIAKKFGLKYPFPEEIKINDLKALQVEWKSCILREICDMPISEEPNPLFFIGIHSMSAKDAEANFLEMFYSLNLKL